MKLYKSLLASLALCGLAVSVTGCQNQFDELEIVAPVATMTPNTTIAEFKKEFISENALQIPAKENGEHYIVKGRVISSDGSGNIYKTIVIQDETSALTFTVNRASLYNYWHLGQELVIDLTDLWVGRYNNLFQIGWLGEPYNGVDQLTFVDFDLFYSHVEMNGFPSTECEIVSYGSAYPSDKMYKISMSLDELRNIPSLTEECVLLQSQLVEFNDVQWLIKEPGETYAIFQTSVNRYLLNENSTEKITVRNSGYANFYNVELPTGLGTVSGILSWYGDGTASSSDAALIPGWQMLIRNLEDCEFDSKGSLEDPYTVAEVIENQNVAKGWVKAYIVGSVVPGVSDITSNSDINFTSADHIANNVVIAASPDVRDYTQCVAVSLPQGTDLRTYVNLESHPENLGKEFMVNGRFDNYLGMAGVTPNSGNLADFELEDLVILTEETIYSALAGSQDNFTFDNVTIPAGGTYVWTWDATNKYLKASGFVGGGAKEALGYAVSPEIDLTGVEAPKASFDQASKFQTTLKTLCKFCVREVGTTEWTELEIPSWPEAGTWNFSTSGDISLGDFAGKKIQVAFKYGSDTSGADTWEVKNLVIKGLK